MTVPAALPLAQRVALVTGGTRGIGRAICERLLTDGASVWIVARSQDDITEAIRQLGSAHDPTRVAGAAADVAVEHEVQRTIDACIERFGRLDIAVANAGIDHGSAFLDVAIDDWDRVIGTNLRGAFLTTQRSARCMLERGGRIVLIASTNASFVESNVASYNASKAGVVGLMRSAALELAPYGITVNAVGPGLIHTEMTADLVQDPVHGPRYLEGIPIGRFGRPRDVAAAVAYLASDDAGWVTGHHLIVDGGQTVGVDLPLETVQTS
jgi:3-oxoacyl-[acyl-carrier protein] reductase